MAMDYTRLKTRIGKILGSAVEVNAYRGTTLSARVATLLAQYPASGPNNDLTVGVYAAKSSASSSFDSWLGYLSGLLGDTIVAELDNDLPLQDTSLAGWVKELRRRMLADAQTFVEAPCTVTPASIGVPVGDPTFVYTRYDGQTGRVSDYIVPDFYLVTCTGDRSSGGTAYAETFEIRGKPADSLPTDATYPSGTALFTSFPLVDPASDGGLVANGGMDTWTTANIPDSWTLGTGVVAGTHTLKSADAEDPRGATGNYSLKLIGDGAVLIKVRQAITASVQPNSVYTAHARLKKSLDPGTDWAVSLLLVDGSGNAVAGPNAYVNTLSSAACSSLTADWLNTVSGTFVTPAVIPASGLYLEIRFHQSGSLTTAPVNTAAVYVDHVAVNAVEPLYAGGIGLNAYSGTLESVRGDARSATVALTSGAIGDFVIRWMDRMLGLASLADRLPTTTSGAATISNSVIS